MRLLPQPVIGWHDVRRDEQGSLKRALFPKNSNGLTDNSSMLTAALDEYYCFEPLLIDWIQISRLPKLDWSANVNRCGRE